MQCRGITLGALICVLACFASAQDQPEAVGGKPKPGGKHGGKGGKGKGLRSGGFRRMFDQDPKFCAIRSIGSSGLCCTLPNLIPNETLKFCAPEWMDKQQRRGGIGPRGKRQAGDAAAPAPSGDGEQKPKGVSGEDMKDYNCIMECVLNAHKMMVDGKVDKAKAKDFLTSAVTDETVRGMVGAAVETCHPLYLASDLKRVSPIIKEAHCLTSNSQFLHCVRRELEVNCPASLVPAKAKTAECAAKKKALEDCDPFYAPSGDVILKKIQSFRAARKHSNKPKPADDGTAAAPAAG